MNRSILLFALIFVFGCGRRGKEDVASLDALLTTGSINRVAFLNYEKDKTNILTGDSADVFLRLLSTSNRIGRSTSVRNKSEGAVYLYNNSDYVYGLHYIPENDALSFGEKYYFGIKGTNQLRDFFE